MTPAKTQSQGTRKGSTATPLRVLPTPSDDEEAPKFRTPKPKQKVGVILFFLLGFLFEKALMK